MDDDYFYRLLNDIKYMILQETIAEMKESRRAKQDKKLNEAYMHDGAVQFGRKILDFAITIEHIWSGSRLDEFEVGREKSTFSKTMEKVYKKHSEEEVPK